MRRSKRKREVTSSNNQTQIEDETEMGKISIKILVDTKTNKVLFAEAGKEFVDFLFHIMSLPVGTIIKLLNVKGMVGCLGSLYTIIESLSTDYFNVGLNKDAVLKAGTPVNNVPLLSLHDNVDVSATTSMEYYLCNICITNGNVTDCKGTRCPRCGNQMSVVLKYFRPTVSSENAASSSSDGSGSGNGGYVKGLVTYMVMDDLEVKPLSTISGITVMNRFRVKDVSALEEKVVKVGLKEGLAMLKASLETNTVLTTVFVAKNKN